MTVKRTLLILGILSFLLPVRRLDAGGPLGDESFRARMETGLSLCEDSAGAFRMRDMESRKWKPMPDNRVKFGKTTSTIWVRIRTRELTGSGMSWYLMVPSPLLDIVDLYVLRKDGWVHLRGGDRTYLGDRQVNNRYATFSIRNGPGEELTYYLKVKSEGFVNFEINACDRDSFLDHFRTDNALYWLVFGFFIIMIIYNLIIFIVSRDMNYLYYVGFITSMLLVMFTMYGFSFQYLWPSLIDWGNTAVPFFMGSSLLMLVIFFQGFLGTSIHFPLMHRVLIGLCVVPSFIMCLLAFAAPYGTSVMISSVGIGYFPVTLVTCSILAARKGSRQAGFFLYSFLVFMVFTFLYFIMLIGLLPRNMFTENMILFGGASMVILLSLGLADKINSMRLQLVDYSKNLEGMVEKRTGELSAALEELEATNDELVRARDELWGEMQLARKLQTVLLPKKPEIPGYEITVHMSTADEVGGDYYDIIQAGGYHWIIIGDVSGHGITAGLVMMMVQTAIHVTLDNHPNVAPRKLLSMINRTIHQNIRSLGEDKYMTLNVHALLDNGTIHFSGLHLDILVYRKKSGTVQVVDTGDMWIGILEDIERANRDRGMRLGIGDTMLLYTDGITEAWLRGSVPDHRDPEREMYGFEKLRDLFRLNGHRPCEEIKKEILASLESYSCDDDVTMMAIRRLE